MHTELRVPATFVRARGKPSGEPPPSSRTRTEFAGGLGGADPRGHSDAESQVGWHPSRSITATMVSPWSEP